MITGQTPHRQTLLQYSDGQMHMINNSPYNFDSILAALATFGLVDGALHPHGDVDKEGSLWRQGYLPTPTRCGTAPIRVASLSIRDESEWLHLDSHPRAMVLRAPRPALACALPFDRERIEGWDLMPLALSMRHLRSGSQGEWWTADATGLDPDTFPAITRREEA